jgi:HD superfamily phosphodiesterase
MIYTEEYIQSLYDLLEPCKEVMGHPEYHPEGTVWTHSFQTLRLALKETDDTDLILAAFMHDVGKQLNKLGHEYEGSQRTHEILGNDEGRDEAQQEGQGHAYASLATGFDRIGKVGFDGETA